MIVVVFGRGCHAGNAAAAGSLFSHVDLEERVRANHPLLVIRGLVVAA